MGSHRITKKHTKSQVLGLMDPLIEKWFRDHFKGLTEPQAYAIPVIHNRENVLVCSPTGSGKTLTAFLAIINELYQKQLRDELEDRIYCLYISPLKALANDIRRNLTTPLEELKALAKETSRPVPKIRTGVRSGDTSASERSKMARKPPHIFITTPESMALILSTPKFSENLAGLEYLIVDEIHEMCNNKRGTMLSLSMERLQERAGNFTRVGLSATQAPIETIAEFLAGRENGKTRPMGIVEVESKKKLDIEVLCPVEDMTALPFEVVNDRMYDLVGELVKKHTTTIVFTNTRAGTESVSYRLQEKGIERLAAHHGSLSKETRLDVEEELKQGKLRGVVSSTSLELGIDIGSIDLVCQIGSPKSIAKGLQRIGRAGHSVGAVPTGRFIVFESDDLVECAVLARHAKEGHIDRVSIPNAPLDILAQTLVGMSLEKRWNVDEAYEMVRRAYPYRDLSRNSYLSVLEYLGARDSDYSYSKLWYDKEDGEFGRKKGARMIYYLNLGAIPDEANYVVYSKTGRRLGKLSEKFVERLAPGDIFVLGGQSYRYNRTRGMKVFVEDSPGQKPTVPSWTGEMLPRSYDLSTAIGAFRRLFAEKVASGEDEANLHSYLRKNYHVDAGSARSILSYVREQLEFDPRLPTDKRLVIEGYIDLRGRYNLVFHACHGRRVNDALSRAYAMAVSNKYHCNVSVSITDDNFMLTLPRKISGDEVASLVTSSNLEELLRSAVRDTELFKQRFRHTASRSFMVLRNYRGREIGVGRQQNRAERIMKILGEEDEHPVVWETYNEILNQAMDLEHAREVLEMIENGQREVVCLSYSDVPSPFAHNVVLAGISDIVLMEDRSTLLRELHRRVLEKIMPEERMKAFLFDADVVRKHFEKKSPSIESCEDILAALETFGPLNLTQHKGDNIFAFSSKPDEIREQANLLLEHMDVASLWKRDLLWTLLHEAPYYTALVEKEAEEPLAPTIMDILEDPMTIKELRTELASRKDLGAVLGNAGKDGFGEGLDGAFKDKSERGSTGKEKPGDAVKEKAKLEIGLGLVEDAVKHMERSNMVCRIGKTGEEYVYMRRPRADIPAGDLDRFVEKCIIRILGHHGPMTREELVYRTGFSSSAVSPCLKALEREGVVDTGHYVIGDDIQFILSEDLVRLKHGDAYSPAEIRRMLWNKHTMKARDIHEYFRRYPTVSRPYDLYPRTDAQAVKEWKKMRTSGDIIEGKFDNGRMCYIRKEDAALYIAAYRKREPRGLEKELLQAISRANGIASDELKKDFPEGQRLKDALSFLDKNMYLVKAYTGVDGWAKKSIYLPTTRIAETQWTGGEEGAWEEILRRFISTYGPVSVSALRFSGLGEPHVRVALSALESKKELVRIPVGQGRSVQEHVMLESELPLLEEACKMGRRREKRDGETNAERGKMGEKEEGTGPDKKAYIMSLFDPYVQPMWAELAARYGERWVYPCFIDGQLVGAVERWDMGGCHEIRDVMVEEPEHLSAVARAIKGEYKHHAAEGLDIIRVRYLDGEPVPNWPPEAVKAFTDQGFSELGDFLVMGPVSKVLYPWPQLLRYVFAKQHLGEYRLKETLDVVKAHGGVRGDGEVEARAENVIPIKNYQEEGVVQWIKGIPDLGTYATPKQAMLYQAARAKKMTKHMKMMYQVALEEKKLWRARVPDHSPLSEGAAFENLKKLFMGVYLGVDQNNSYVPLPISSISKAEARKEFVREMFKHFGLFNAPQLTAFIRGEFRTSEVRNILDELVKEGFLAKGFMRQDSEEVHWMLAEEHENIEAIQARPTGVITADDRLIYYLSEELRILYKMNTGYIVLKDGDIIGAFKAKKRKTHLEITDFFGEPEAKAIALEYAGAPPEKEEYGDEEWEIIQYVEKHIKRTGGEDRRRKRD